jgi:hypothetical protein
VVDDRAGMGNVNVSRVVLRLLLLLIGSFHQRRSIVSLTGCIHARWRKTKQQTKVVANDVVARLG